jgi:molybdopterin molybdotransferase
VATDCEVRQGQNVHLAGKDHDTGAELLAAGLTITSARLAVLASVGMVEVPVARRPRVLVAATGDELIPPEGQPEAWQLRASNGPAITAALAAAGYDAQLCHWPDSEEVLSERIGGALESHDVLVFSGGISAGKKDYLKPVCEGLGVEFQFLRVQQRPGKPFAYGVKGERRVFCLPGNPVSALAGLHRYVLPELMAAEGRPQAAREVVLADSFSFGKPLAFFLPVRLEGGKGVPCAPNGSGDWATPAKADGIIEIPAEVNEAAAGQSFRFYSYW